MTLAACILLCAIGHLVRDGVPTTGSTQLARFLGAALCFGGALCVHPWQAAALAGAAVYAGFYTDMKHGDGQGADTPASIAYLFLSGFTSLTPLAIVTAPHGIVLCLAVGAAKPPIWVLAWLGNVSGKLPGVYPTRVAATAFGAAVGVIVALTVAHPPLPIH